MSIGDHRASGVGRDSRVYSGKSTRAASAPVLCGKIFGQRITGAAAAAFILLENSAPDQIGDITQRRIRRAFLDDGPFRGGELAFETIQQAVNDVALAVI